MWTNIFISIGISIATILIMYIDSRLFDKPKARTTYIKNVLLTNIITFVVIYVLTWLSPSKNISDIVQNAGEKTANKMFAGNTMALAQLGEEMLAGDAPF